ncbi:hypothetical protein SASPL_136145 [Salvia splendens]|uniref:Pentatricopeptide repeat-containing protein n=1 Tax=Salvia splendens TaxID=180675 RepID=A0A8X8WZC6_SALSN|nr:hypothetical protein SASPL_136145 [Salvia splendens]
MGFWNRANTASCSIIKALETLNLMRDNVPDKLTVYDYNAMIRYFLKSGSVAFDELFEVYSGMKRFGPKPKSVNLSNTLEWVHFCWKIERCNVYYRRDDGMWVFPFIYNSVKVVQEATENRKSLPCRDGSGRNSIVCEAFGKGPLFFFGFLEKKGFVHSVYSYTALVHGFSKDRLWREVFFYLEEMENVGCKPSLVTYTVLIKSLCDDGKLMWH